MGGLRHWLTRNWADTDEPGDPSLAPVSLALPPRDALDAVRAAVDHLPRWRVASTDPDLLLLRATRRTRLFRFVDDVTVRIERDGGGSRVHARSQSRVGRGDFGQNRRNLLELFAALDHSGRAGVGAVG